MFRGSKKDPGFASRCFGAEEKTAQNNAWRLKKRLCSFSRPHCGAEKKLEVEKKTCRGRKQDGPIARSRKRHFGVEKKSSPFSMWVLRIEMVKNGADSEAFELFLGCE